MSQIELLNRLLDDMDTVRPIVIAAMPDDVELRATTRRMIASLEQIRQQPGIPQNTYLWLSQMLAKLLDAQHGPLLRPNHSGTVSSEARTAIEAHVEQRQLLIMQALQDIPTTHILLDSSSEMIGEKAHKSDSLQKRARHLQKLLQKHLQDDSALRTEVQQLVDALSPSLNAISKVLEEAGEESHELRQARLLLEQDRPDNAEEARAMLQQARQGILNAGNRLSSASERLHDTIQSHVESLSTLSRQLEEAESEARNDPLTGLANRRRLAEYLKSLGQSSFSFLVIDIDHFKSVNDTWGHDAGDSALKAISRIILDVLRETDIVGRIGGEEFVAILPETSLTEGAALAERLRATIEKAAIETTQDPINVTISIGVAALGDLNGTLDAVIAHADAAMYQAKHAGRNRVHLHAQTEKVVIGA